MESNTPPNGPAPTSGSWREAPRANATGQGDHPPLTGTGTDVLGGNSWRRQTPSAAETENWLRRLFLRSFFTLLSIALVFLLFYSLMTVYHPAPLVTGFTSSAPPLAEAGLFSAEDQFKLSRLGLPDGTLLSGPIVSFHNISDQLTSASGEGMLSAVVEKLKSVRPGGPNNNTVIVYLSAAGVLDTRGNACLVPSTITAGLDVDTDSQLVRVDRLLAALRAAVPSKIALIVVLDCCRPGAWPLGIADGGFACGVESAAAEVRPGRCWTILPCGPGQVSQQSAVAHGSALPYFFSVGLQGAADSRPFGNADRIVDLAELMAYLKDQIDRWAVATCGERQSPAIYPALNPSSNADKITLSRGGFFWKKDRFPLKNQLLTRFGYASDESSVAKRGEGKAVWINERWRAAESLRSIGVHCKPYIWQEYLQLLMRMERLDQAGGNAQEVFRNSARVEQLENALDSVRFYGFEQLPSLRLAAIGGRGASRTGLDLNAAEWRDQIATHVSTPPDANAPPAAITPAASADEWTWRAIIAWDWLTDRLGSGLVVDHVAMSRWLEFLGRSPAETATEPLEIHVTRMMVRWIEPTTWDGTAPLLGKLLRLVGRSQRARYSTEASVDACLDHMTSRLMVEKKLREAIDLAIVGTPAALARAAQLAEEVAVPIENSVMLSDEVATAFQLNETICDEIPWLAVWHANERRAAAATAATAINHLRSSSPDAIDLETLADHLWRFRYTLSQTLRDLSSNADGSPVEAIEPLQRSREELESRFTILKSDYLNTCDRLASSTADTPAVLASIQRVLAIPLVRGATRGKLLQRARTLADQFALLGHHNVVSQTEPLPSVEPTTAVAGWIRWHQMWVHPLLPFIIKDVRGSASLPTNSAELTQAMGREREQVERATRHLMAESMSDDDRSVVQADPAGGPTVSSAIAACEQADASRRFAAIVGRSIEHAETSPLNAWLFAWRRRLFSAAQHSLQDFWAGVEPGDPIWCTAAARAYLRAVNKFSQVNGAESLIQDTGDTLRAVERIEESEGAIVSLANNPKAAIVGVATDALSGAANHTTVSPLLPEVPEGVGALWLAGSANAQPLSVTEFSGVRIPDRVERMPVPFSAPSRSAVVSWTASASPFVPGLDGSSQMLDMVFWFRGHRLVRGMPVSATEALRTVEWNRAMPSQTRVSVRGDAVRNRSVAIIFDASGSMGQRLLDGRTRLESGREALYEVLDLMKQDGWNASLWVYGHRTRWSRDERGRYTAGLTALGTKERDAVLKTGKKFALLPGDDVEQILDMQPLSPVEVLRIRSLLDGLEAGGETPLYLAINEALRGDFAFSEPGPGHVLVVTDGANEQSGGRMTSYADVLRTLSRVNFKRIAGHEVRIDVIGFNFVPGQFDREARLQDLQSLAADSGGRFFDATDPMKLGTSLRQSLRMMRWQVEGAGAPREAVTIGNSLDLSDPVNGQTDSYDVVLDAGPSSPRRRIGVSGGESLDLRVTGNGRVLQFERYTGGSEHGIRDSYDDLPDPSDPKRRWFVAAHLARRELGSVRFPISIQNGKPADFSPRPLELWAEIRPKLADSTLGSPYILWDLDYQPSRPVPVIELVAPSWPTAAATAEIRTWFRFTPTPPDMVLPLADLVPGVERMVDVANMPQSRLRLFLSPAGEKDQVQLTVIEEHDVSKATGASLLRVAVSPSCQRAVHSRQQNSIRVRHTFLINTDHGKLPAAAACTVTDSRRIQEGAVGLRSQIGLPAVLTVPVPSE